MKEKKRSEGREKGNKPSNIPSKVRKMNPNSTCYVQILGTGMDTQDTSPSVLLFFDKKRFIFNAGEGLQRFCTEHKIKLSKVDYIFLSRVCSETAGGLSGLMLTLAGMGEDAVRVNMWGPPPGIDYLLDAMRTFVRSDAMVNNDRFGNSLDPDGRALADSKKSIGPIKIFEDGLVTISAIILQASVDNEPKDSKEAGSGVSHSANGESCTVVKPGDLSVIYVCELSDIQGKFYPEKARALGLKPGPIFQALQAGNSVKSDDSDIMVHPSDVMDPPVPGPIVLFVDCPTASHLQCLLAMNFLNQYYTDFSGNQSDTAKTVDCVIHLSPSSVTNIPDYKTWMKRFRCAQHIMAGYEQKNVGIPVLKASARIAVRLNYLCPRFFPTPRFWSLHNEDNSSLSSDSSAEVPQATILAENLLKFYLRPRANLGLDWSCVPDTTSPAEIIAELLTEIPEITDAAQQVQQLWDRSVEANGDIKSSGKDNSIIRYQKSNEVGLPSCLKNISRDDMEIVLLGTGSAQPSKYRNVSSIYINLFSRGGLLFDCGEGTLGQLKRRFGIEGADNVVKSLRCIWISHIHADHHSGLARILSFRHNLLKGIPHERLLVVGPTRIGRFLGLYEQLEELDMQFLDCLQTTGASWDAFERSVNPNMNQLLSNLNKVLQDAGLKRLASFPVEHCPKAFGVALTAAERISSVGKIIPGWKVVYSGDTRPCAELMEASRGATVLIHEATFEDGMLEEAVAKKHSTTKEAIEMGEGAGVYRIILTHFSQRYPKIPVVEDAQMHNNTACIAFDLMSINMADLPLLPHLLPYLKLLFRNEAMPVDDDAMPVDSE
uniref:ribonuclease Z n=1 Tax=Opuntia streptacantha TaxID=393608 RepID=A0A7C9A5Q2_OPUST